MSKRTARIAAVVLGIAIALALLAWYLRDTLIREISNPLLGKYGVEVTDVSLDALATRDASISYLELSYEDDTVIAIEGLTLPIVGSAAGIKTYSARRVSIEIADSSEGPPEVAPLVEQVLALGPELAGNEFLIAELHVPPYPTVHDVRWTSTGDEQRLDARIESNAMSVSILRDSEAGHDIEFSIPAGRIVADLQRSDGRFSLSGSSDLDLPSWSPLAKLAGIVPGEIRIDAGTGRLTLAIDIPFDSRTPPTAQVRLAPTSPVRLSYAHASGDFTSVALQSGDPVQISAVFPEVDWTLRQAVSTMLVSYEDWSDIPLLLSDVTCKPGPACSMKADVTIENRVLPLGHVGEARLSASLDAAFTDDAVEIRLQPGALADLRQLASDGIEAGRIEARFVSPGTLDIIDTGWSLTTDSVDGKFEGLQLAEDLEATAPFFLEDVALSKHDGLATAASGIFVPGVQATWLKRAIDLAGIRGELSLRGDSMKAELRTVGLYQDGALHLQHDRQNGNGTLRLDESVVSFGATPLSERISPWQRRWDLGEGSIAVSGVARWQGSSEVMQGSLSAAIAGLSGYFEDSVFADLSTALQIDYAADGRLSIAPAGLTVGLLDVGVPITDISANYLLDPDEPAVAVENLRMTALGGVVRADPFSFHTASERNTLLLHAESLEMDELLTVREFEAIEVTGSISATLPVSIAGDAVTIDNGTLSGEPPGGVIRYLPGAPPDESDASSLAFVRKVLSNFRYESLTSVVDYTEGGDLKLQLRLEGRNPDMDETRPVVLNLDVENNVPQMLRSLRATRAVEEVLEQRFQQQRDGTK